VQGYRPALSCAQQQSTKDITMSLIKCKSCRVLVFAIAIAGLVVQFVGSDASAKPKSVVLINYKSWKAELANNQLAAQDKYKDVLVTFKAQMYRATQGIGGITVEMFSDGLPIIAIFDSDQFEALKEVNRRDVFHPICATGILVDFTDCKVSR
jgi:hypothetical protein